MVANAACDTLFVQTYVRNHAWGLAQDLQSTLSPHIQALVNVAAAMRNPNPASYAGSQCEDQFVKQMTDIFEKAIILKLQVAASPHEYHSFRPQHGTFFAGESMTLAYPTENEPSQLQVAYTVHSGFTAKYLFGDHEYENIALEAEVIGQRTFVSQS